jgi:hypothetical protein
MLHHAGRYIGDATWRGGINQCHHHHHSNNSHQYAGTLCCIGDNMAWWGINQKLPLDLCQVS